MINLRLQIALAAQRGLILYHADVSNAFAKAECPEQMYYMSIDAPFCEWWNTRFPNHPLLPGQAIPIQKNLQGHPEAPRQWSIHIHGILVTKLALVPTTHAPFRPAIQVSLVSDSSSVSSSSSRRAAASLAALSRRDPAFFSPLSVVGVEADAVAVLSGFLLQSSVV
jgi:hypothetical protein